MIIGLWLLFAVLSFVDIFLTYKIIKKARKLKCEDEFREQNPLTKWLWDKYGLKKGSIIAGCFSISCVAFIVYLLENNFLFNNIEKFNFMCIGVLLGIYVFVLITHIHLLRDLRGWE